MFYEAAFNTLRSVLEGANTERSRPQVCLRTQPHLSGGGPAGDRAGTLLRRLARAGAPDPGPAWARPSGLQRPPGPRRGSGGRGLGAAEARCSRPLRGSRSPTRPGLTGAAGGTPGQGWAPGCRLPAPSWASGAAWRLLPETWLRRRARPARPSPTAPRGAVPPQGSPSPRRRTARAERAAGSSSSPLPPPDWPGATAGPA